MKYFGIDLALYTLVAVRLNAKPGNMIYRSYPV